MIKRIVVAGGRKYKNYEEAKGFIDFCVENIREQYELVFVSGGCRGADMLGERYAKENGFKIERYLPDWEKYGKSAGPKRNKQMAQVGDYIICFWDGQSKGTKSMIEFSKSLGKPVRIKRYEKGL